MMDAGLQVEVPTLTAADKCTPGELITYSWRKATFLGLVIEPREQSSGAEVLALAEAGSTSVPRSATYLTNISDIRKAAGAFHLKVGTEFDMVFPPPLVGLNTATLIVDDESAPWVLSSDQYHDWWTNPANGARTQMPVMKRHRGFDSWSIWREVGETHERIATATSAGDED